MGHPPVVKANNLQSNVPVQFPNLNLLLHDISKLGLDHLTQNNLLLLGINCNERLVSESLVRRDGPGS